MQSNSTFSSPSVPHPSPLALYHALWQQQDHSVVKQGLKCKVFDMEGRLRHLTYDAIDLSRHLGIKLPSGATCMFIRPMYKSLFHKITRTEKIFVVHGQAGIVKSTSFRTRPQYSQLPLGKTHFLAYILVRWFLARQPVIYQIDELESCVLCFIADGFFTLPLENSENHPLFQREDVLHLVESAHGDSITHPNTDHARALIRGACDKAIFTKF
ncbi:uncharacterized protein EDB91DRAFT_1245804 [Suillus paluster]|uniref:uncharacterized protein n=1 Tax=Suillus paluster TaxID=48578 RepID=UPI001B87367B|nr:uncharacterized protein EDB91DRAFT_1245804 [Suillus paluster]KAG1746618.1 hypothetical protein EDB91DRAFT_1245804 [Suillus paluster]